LPFCATKSARSCGSPTRESFGKGREVPNFRPAARARCGARRLRYRDEDRIERTIEQRTAMLAGVSHDLRTILTPLQARLALIGDSPEIDAMRKDVGRDGAHARAYLAFARGDSGEQFGADRDGGAARELRSEASAMATRRASPPRQPVVTVRPAALKRCLANLVSNPPLCPLDRDHRPSRPSLADRDSGRQWPRQFRPHQREEVFKPFSASITLASGQGGTRARACDCARYRALAWRRHQPCRTRRWAACARPVRIPV